MNKPGIKTTEWWLSLAAVLLGALVASGIIPSGGIWDKVIGMAISALAAVGYTAGRAFVKSNEARAAAISGAAPLANKPSA